MRNVRIKALGDGKDGYGANPKLWHVLIGSLLGDDRAKLRAAAINACKVSIAAFERLYAEGHGDETIAAQIAGLQKTLNGLRNEHESEIIKLLLDFWVKWTEQEFTPPPSAELREVANIFSATRAAAAARENVGRKPE
jgi:hypothetical protein